MKYVLAAFTVLTALALAAPAQALPIGGTLATPDLAVSNDDLAAFTGLTALAISAPDQALPIGGTLAAPDLVVSNDGVDNLLSWSYPDGIKAKDVSSVEVTRLDGLSTAVFSIEPRSKNPTFVDAAASPNAYYSIRYTTDDGESSENSKFHNSYPYCDEVLDIREVPPRFADQCFFPLPI